MERNVKLIVAYDGTGFCGWQTQPGLRTAQEELAGVVARVFRHPVQIIGASRTDSGVHARGQVANVRTTSEVPIENLRRAIASRLPPDLTVVHAAVVPDGFHATRDAREKLYRYVLHNSLRRPVEELSARYVWHAWHALDLDRMRAAAAHLIGRHDFAALANKGSPRMSTVRAISRVGIWRRGERIAIDVQGDGFLYNQVRVIVGTLVEIGRGHWKPERMAAIIRSSDRSQAGPTAPPEGLCLQWVRYDAPGSMDNGA